MKFVLPFFVVAASATGALLLTQCSSSDDAASVTTDAGGDASLAACPAVEPQVAEPCPTQAGLTCTFGCDTVFCDDGAWSEIGSGDATVDAGGCPTTLPSNGDTCADSCNVTLCDYGCSNHFGAYSAQCIGGFWQVDTSDPRCAIDLDAGDASDALDAGDAGDGT